MHPDGPSPFLLGPAHARQTPLSPLCFRRQRTRGTRRPRAPRSGRCRAPSAGRGQAPRHPLPPRRVAPPPDPPPLLPFPPPLSRCRRAISSPLAAPLVLPSPLLSDSPSRAPNSPHRSPRLDRHRHPMEASPSCGFWPSTAAVRHSSVSSSPSYQSLQFLAISSPPCLSGAAEPHTRRGHPPEPPPRRQAPPPDAVCVASPSTCRSGAPLPSPPCPAPSP
jgi:hypothetical protein